MRCLFLLFFYICLAGCSTSYRFEIHNNLAESSQKKSIYFSKDDYLDVVEKGLLDNGWSIVNKLEKAQYIGIITLLSDTYEVRRAIPIYGKTGINSINTYHLGGGMSTSYVNYAHGITGYTPYVDYYTNKIFYFGIYDKKNRDEVFNVKFFVDKCPSDIGNIEFTEFANELFEKYFNEKEFVSYFYCQWNSQGKAYCGGT